MAEITTYPLTRLLAQLDSSLNAISVNNALVKIGILRDISYESTTGSGKLRHFYTFTESGAEFGIDMSTRHEFRTQTAFYEDSFPRLLVKVAEYLLLESQRIASTVPD